MTKKTYEVIGYDRKGAELCRLSVDAVSPNIARLVAIAQLRRTPHGSDAVDRAVTYNVQEVR
jgi:hypothetical protein